MAYAKYLLKTKMAPANASAILLLTDQSIYWQGSAGPVRVFTPG